MDSYRQPTAAVQPPPLALPDESEYLASVQGKCQEAHSPKTQTPRTTRAIRVSPSPRMRSENERSNQKRNVQPQRVVSRFCLDKVSVTHLAISGRPMLLIHGNRRNSTVQTVPLQHTSTSHDFYDSIIIASPRSDFSEARHAIPGHSPPPPNFVHTHHFGINLPAFLTLTFKEPTTTTDSSEQQMMEAIPDDTSSRKRALCHGDWHACMRYHDVTTELRM